jgi:hypothetical protein
MEGAGSYSAKIVIENDTDRPRIVWVEPWGEDYTLLPKEKLEVIVRNGSEPLWFHVVEYVEGCQVYVEGYTNDYEVTQNDRIRYCGHQRRAAIDAGLKL